MRRFRKITGLFMTIVMLTTLSSVAFAEVAKDEKNKLREIESRNAALEQKKSEAQAEVEKLDSEAAQVSASLNKTNEKLAKTEDKITTTTDELKKAEKSADEQYESMKVRIQYMYENGNTQIIDLFFNSDSITDFMDKAEYITELSGYDRDMLDKMVATKNKIAKNKSNLETQKKELVSLKEDQQSSVDKLIALSESKQKEVKSYKGLIAQNRMHAADLEAEIAAKEKAAAEAEAKAKQNGNGNNSPSQQNTPSVTPSNTASGKFGWPLPGYSTITSDYGDTSGRSSGHNGVDIGAPAGAQIVAAGPGRVEWACYSNSAGNWVGINHGNGLYTVYMHMSALGTSAGQTVSAGTPIGYVGTTGWSTGNHLHFGVRLNGYWVNPWDYL